MKIMFTRRECLPVHISASYFNYHFLKNFHLFFFEDKSGAEMSSRSLPPISIIIFTKIFIYFCKDWSGNYVYRAGTSSPSPSLPPISIIISTKILIYIYRVGTPPPSPSLQGIHEN